MGIYNRARAQLAPPNMDFTHGGCRAFRVEAGYLKDAEEMLGGVTNLNSWTHTARELENFKPQVKVKKSVTSPAAYSFAATETRLIVLLNRHRSPMPILECEQEAEAETNWIRHMTDAGDKGKPAILADLEKVVAKETLDAGTVFVPVSGAASNLVPLILEPEPTWGIVSSRATGKYRFNSYLVEAGCYPVKRLKSIELSDGLC